MPRVAPFVLLVLAALALGAPEALAQAGGGSSGFGGGGGGSGGGGGGGGGGGFGGGSGGSSSDGDGSWDFFDFIVIGLFALFFLGGPGLIWKKWSFFSTRFRTRRRRGARDERVSTASAEAAEDDPVFAAASVKSQAAALYAEIQGAWSARDDATLERLLGRSLLAEWRLRLADFERRGWVNEVTIRRGPEVQYVGLVNREDDAEDRVTVTISATLHSVVRTTEGATITRDVDSDGDGEIEVCEYWTLTRAREGWCLRSIEQEMEGTHHLSAEIVPAPWSDDSRLTDETLVELATADAPPPGTNVSELVSVAFEGSAREQALDLALADPRCAPDVLEVAARQAAQAWAEAVDGDDDALLAVATPEVAHALLYPYGEANPRARIVVRAPQLLALTIVALQVDRDPPRMEVEAQLRGTRYVEDRDTVALLSGSRDDAIDFSERWTFELAGDAITPWLLIRSG